MEVPDAPTGLARGLLFFGDGGVPMAAATNAPPTQHVYRGRGAHSVRVPLYQTEDVGLLQVPTIADLVPASRIMSRDVICAREDLEIGALMDLMVRRHIGCIPVVDDRGHPVGMVTKLDVIEQLVAARDPAFDQLARTTAELMMPLAITLDEHATVAHTAAMMTVEGVHHVPIVADTGVLIGVVSTMDIVRWLATNDGVMSAQVGESVTG
jgi:CBS domain-containing protein